MLKEACILEREKRIHSGGKVCVSHQQVSSSEKNQELWDMVLWYKYMAGHKNRHVGNQSG